MDDADGGVRGLRAGPGPGLFETLRVHYGLGSPAERVDLGGSSSLNLLLGDGDRRYAVRVHRPSVTPERLAAIHHARGALLAGEVPARRWCRPSEARHGSAFRVGWSRWSPTWTMTR